MRAHLIQEIFVSAVSAALSITSPPSAAESSASAVAVSVDTMNIQAAYEILIECMTSLIVIGVGSFMLYRLLWLAFIGPVLLASACTAVPFLLGSRLQNNQKKVLEAAERRIEATNYLLLNTRDARLEDMEQIELRSIQAAREAEIRRTAMYGRFDILVILIGTFIHLHVRQVL